MDHYTAAGIAEGFVEAESEEQVIEAWQYLINTGLAWRLQGHVGRTARDLIQAGVCTLAEESQQDYYGNKIPSRDEVKPGTPGSVEYVKNHK